MIETKCVCGVSYYFGEAWDHVNCKAPVVKEKIVEQQQTLHLPDVAKKRGRPPKVVIDDRNMRI